MPCCTPATGSIRVALAATADLTVDASTSDGKVIVDGQILQKRRRRRFVATYR